jgi:glutamate dehydrogenase (NAD(P)+)
MARVMDTYAMHVRRAMTAVVTGKPLDLGGSRGRREATGRGVMICCDKALAKLKRKREGCRVIIQGFGNVGSQAALWMHAAGYEIIGVADINGGLYNEKGFDIPKLVNWVHAQQKPLQEFPGGGEKMTAQEVLFCPCDILVPAATENQITAQNADRVDCRILCEGANGPVTSHADPIIDKRGSSSFRIFSRMLAALRSAISNGCGTARAFSGARAK